MKRKLFYICLVVLLTVGCESGKDITDVSLTTAEYIVKMVAGKEDRVFFMETTGYTLSEEFIQKLDKFKQDLLTLNNAKYNLTEVYRLNFLNSTEDPEIEGSPSVEDSLYPESESLESTTEVTKAEEIDERVFTENGEDYIMVKDLIFDEEGLDVVLYKGSYMLISKEDVPLTYDMMKRDPSTNYLYKEHLSTSDKGTGKIEVLFSSVGDKGNLLVRLFSEDGMLVDFEVIQ